MNGVAFDLVRDAEVDDLERATDNHKVRRLEVGVNDLAIMDDLDALEHLRHRPIEWSGNVSQRAARVCGWHGARRTCSQK